MPIIWAKEELMRVQVIGPSEDPHVLIRQAEQKRQRIKEALECLIECQAVMENRHFRFGRGKDERHGRKYVNPRRLFNKAFKSKRLVSALADAISTEIQSEVDIVAGPETGGIIVARDLADFLSTKRKKGEPDVEALFLSKDWNDVFTLHKKQDYDETYLIHESDRDRLVVDDFGGKRPARILLVDDILHRGLTFAACKIALEEAGGKVIATAELIDRGEHALNLGLPNFYVGQLDPDQLYKPSECPMCKTGTPITKF